MPDEYCLSCRHPDWQLVAKCLIESLLAKPILYKLMEAELLLWRVFESSMSHNAMNINEARELHKVHTRMLGLLELAQRRQDGLQDSSFLPIPRRTRLCLNSHPRTRPLNSIRLHASYTQAHHMS